MVTKLNFWKYNYSNEVKITTDTTNPFGDEHPATIFCTVELDVMFCKKPKKWVEKSILADRHSPKIVEVGVGNIGPTIPLDARNVRIVYEVPE